MSAEFSSGALHAFDEWQFDVDEEQAFMSSGTSYRHETVLLREVIEGLGLREGGIYLDVTLGGGGHSEGILRATQTARVFGFDRDTVALEAARARLEEAFGARFLPIHASFDDVPAEAAEMGLGPVDGVVADLGVSSPQLDDALRGMSFRLEGPLDMRMDQTSGETALELIGRLDADELADVIYQYGEERRSRRIARCIKQAYEAGELVTTLDLRRAVVRAVGPMRKGGVDPATCTFQALRIAVNDELGQVERMLESLASLVRVGGVAAIISFHSLEDRLAKRAFADRTRWEPLTKKPMIASDEEVARNPRARSAKLRLARRIEEAPISARGGSMVRLRASRPPEPRPDQDDDGDDT